MPRAQHAIDENKLNAFIGQMLSDLGGAASVGGHPHTLLAFTRPRAPPKWFAGTACLTCVRVRLTASAGADSQPERQKRSSPDTLRLSR